MTVEKLWPAKARWVSGNAAIDSASARAFWARYRESREAMAAVSSRTSSTGRENHLSIERFINPYAKKNIMMTGRNESSKPPTTSRVRNLDPRTPSLRSANSFSRLRASTKVSAKNKRKMTAESAAKNRSCWLVSGLRNGRSNEDWESRIPKRTKIPIASRTIIFFRLGVSLLRVELGVAKFQPARLSLKQS